MTPIRKKGTYFYTCTLLEQTFREPPARVLRVPVWIALGPHRVVHSSWWWPFAHVRYTLSCRQRTWKLPFTFPENFFVQTPESFWSQKIIMKWELQPTIQGWKSTFLVSTYCNFVFLVFISPQLKKKKRTRKKWLVLLILVILGGAWHPVCLCERSLLTV